LSKPYCNLPASKDPETGLCRFVQLGPADVFLLNLKVALWLGLILAAPVWLYQLWAFIAPGLHRNERRYAYAFASIAAPLFAAGAVLAYFVVEKGLHFQLEITRYISFVTSLILIFGVAFEFPLVALMLNVVGIASGRRLLSWWRVAVFVFFLFSAIVTPTPDPFGMTALALCLSVLYFMAVGAALLNDRRRNRHAEVYAGLDDDEASPIDFDDAEPVEPGEPVEAAATPVPAPLPLDRRYDDTT
jgi:sec-independent protein translocase protein TatC